MTFIKKTLEDKPSFCILPFLAICIDAKGWHKPCCFYKDNHGEKNAEDHSLTEILHADVYKNLRTQFLEGEKPEGCRRCWINEEMGIRSFRQDLNESHGQYFDESLLEQPEVRIIDYGYGNTCNAACLSCHSGASSKWSETDRELLFHNSNQFGRFHQKNSRLTFPKWTDEEHASLREISLSQGESMMNIGFEKAVEKMVQSGNSQKMTISVLSNAGYYPKQSLIDNLKKFKKVRFELSIDGIGDRFEYLRYPLKMGSLEESVRRYVQVCSETKSFFLEAHCTISLLNLLYVDEVREWWSRMLGSGLEKSLTFGYCWDPIYLSPNLAPSALREKVKEVSKENYVLNLVSSDESPDPRIKEQGLDHLLRQFREFITFMDKKRGLDARATFPETFKALEL